MSGSPATALGVTEVKCYTNLLSENKIGMLARNLQKLSLNRNCIFKNEKLGVSLVKCVRVYILKNSVFDHKINLFISESSEC